MPRAAAAKGIEVPWEYIELQLCRDVYHCTPEELDRQDWERVRVHLRLLGAEGRAERDRGFLA